MPPLKLDTGNKKAATALRALNVSQPLALNEAPVPSDSSYNATAMTSPYPWNDERKFSFANNRLSMLEELTRECPIQGIRPTTK